MLQRDVAAASAGCSPALSGLVLALVRAVAASRRPARVIVYLLALVAAFEMSLGFGGYTFRFLHDHVVAYRALRAPARLGDLRR